MRQGARERAPSLHGPSPGRKTVPGLQSCPRPRTEETALHPRSREPRRTSSPLRDGGADGPHTSTVKGDETPDSRRFGQ